MLLRDHSSFLVRRSGHAFSSEPGNLGGLHNYKYSLSQPRALCIRSCPEGVMMCRRGKATNTGKVAGSFTKPVTVKKNAVGANRTMALARDLESTGYRLDLVRPAQAKMCALLRSHKARKTLKKETRAGKRSKKN